MQGEPLTITEKGRAFGVTDSKGHTARITIADVLQSNGVIHVINKVLMPRTFRCRRSSHGSHGSRTSRPVDLIATREHDLRDAEAARLA